MSQRLSHYPYDSYWRSRDDYDYHLTRELRTELQDRGYTYTGRKNRLVQLLRRSDAGLFFYEECSIAELEQFAQQRRLTPHADLTLRTEERYKLHVNALEREDQRPRFERLFDLPAELRHEVYRYYMAGLSDEPLHAPTVPPLARLSRQLCSEIMPIFFDDCLVDIHLIMKMIGTEQGNPNLPPRLQLTSQTTRFFALQTPDALAAIKKLRFCRFDDRKGKKVIDIVCGW